MRSNQEVINIDIATVGRTVNCDGSVVNKGSDIDCFTVTSILISYNYLFLEKAIMRGVQREGNFLDILAVFQRLGCLTRYPSPCKSSTHDNNIHIFCSLNSEMKGQVG